MDVSMINLFSGEGYEIEGAVSNYEQDESRSIGRRGRILPVR